MSGERGEEPVVLEGTVVRGDGRGRLLGFPTANIGSCGGEALPEDGIYAGLLRRADGSLLQAAISIGDRPTYYGDGGERLLEAHLLDFEGDLYGERVQLLVGPRVRGQRRFSSTEELIELIAVDLGHVRALTAEMLDSREVPEAS